MNEAEGILNDFDRGLLTGLLIGEGHFGGDGKQPQITLRMHQRHETLFRWLVRAVPGSRLYGPYSHGGRNYFQWMARGQALRGFLWPLLDQVPLDLYDSHTRERFQQMVEKYQMGPLPPEGEKAEMTQVTETVKGESL